MARNTNTGGSRFTKRYTATQKDAILKAVLIDGRTVQEAIRMAKAGQLDVPAFTIGNYAYDIVRDGREGFETRNDEALANGTRSELRRLHSLNLRRSRGLDTNSDVAEIARVAKALAETQRALGTEQKAKPKAKPTAPSNTQPTAPQGATVISSLLDKANTKHTAPSNTREGARSGSISRAQNDDPSTAVA